MSDENYLENIIRILIREQEKYKYMPYIGIPREEEKLNIKISDALGELIDYHIRLSIEMDRR